MRWRALFLIAALGGCSGGVDSFHVYDPTGTVRAAHVSLCGSDTPMLQHGNHFFAGVPIACEEGGHIRLTFRNGNHADCTIGNATNLSQSWYFRAGDASCEPRRLHA